MKFMTVNINLALTLIITLNLIIKIKTQSQCSNPNKHQGKCISIYDCPSLISTIQRKPLGDRDKEFLQKSQCGENGNAILVCCTDDTEFITDQVPQTTKSPEIGKSVGGNELPRPPQCGKIGLPNKIYNGVDTYLDEFPWMALLEYKKKNGNKELACGGSLINKRYVLTAAHCVTGAVSTKVGQLISVRLGEFDVSTENDCDAYNECANPTINIDIEEIIPHENFNDTLVHRYHDIALIRLKQDVIFNDFIKPICLPSSANLVQSSIGANVTVAGWGRTLMSRSSRIKQKLAIPIYDHNECIKKFLTKRVNIIDSQLCAGGSFAQDTCDGDSGGPLMALQNGFLAIEGVVSFGNLCGLENWPAIYTRVSSYEDWIKTKLKP